MGSSGKKHHETFAHLGVQRRDSNEAPPSAFTIAEAGHYLHDPHSPSTPPVWLVDSIREDGLLVPIIVKREADKLIVSGGRTRVLAGRIIEAERKKSGEPAPMFRYTLLDGAEDKAERAMHVENTHRRIIGPATKASTIATYRGKSWPDAAIAPLIAEPGSNIDKLAVVNDCCPTVRALMEAGRIDWQLAPMFAALPVADQKAKASDLVAAGVVGGRKAREHVAGKKAKRSEAPSRKVIAAMAAGPFESVNVETADYDNSEYALLVADVLAYASGNPKALRKAWPEMAAALDGAWAAASKPGRKAK